MLLSNVTKHELVIVAGPLPSDPEGAPWVYYAGDRTAAVYWGMAQKPQGIVEYAPTQGALLKRVSPGETVQLSYVLENGQKERTGWGSLTARSAANMYGADDADQSYVVDRMVLVIGWWNADVFANSLEQSSAVQRRIGGATPWTELGDPSFGRAIARKIASQSTFWQAAEWVNTQCFIVVGPIELETPLLIRCIQEVQNSDGSAEEGNCQRSHSAPTPGHPGSRGWAGGMGRRGGRVGECHAVCAA